MTSTERTGEKSSGLETEVGRNRRSELSAPHRKQAPAFGRIVVRAQLSKVIFVVDEDHVGLPGELVDFLADNLIPHRSSGVRAVYS